MLKSIEAEKSTERFAFFSFFFFVVCFLKEFIYEMFSLWLCGF